MGIPDPELLKAYREASAVYYPLRDAWDEGLPVEPLNDWDAIPSASAPHAPDLYEKMLAAEKVWIAARHRLFEDGRSD